MNSPRLLKLAGPVLLASLATCSLLKPEGAAAALTYDLRVDGGKVAYVNAIGQVITLDLFAQVTGVAGNPAAEGFQEGFGSVLSSAGGNISGSLTSTFVAPWDANGSVHGMQQNLDGDGDLDLGSNATAHSTEFFFARAGAMRTTGGTAITDGVEFKIATFSFTVQSIADFFNGPPISINFRVPLFANSLDIEALWQEDGIATSSNGLNGGLHPTVGAAVMLSVPEPSIAGFLVVAAAGLVARRRRSVPRC